MNYLKDNSILKPCSDFVFTQYLYVKDEVCLALLVSILNKSDDAVFWAFELYYSGFKHELLKLIWKIYYDFFATLNPSYEAYLYKKNKELSSNSNNEVIISSIIQDLLFRPFNTDIFMLRNVCEIFEIDIVYHHSLEKINNIEEFGYNMKQWIVNNDFRSIGQWILNVNKNVNKDDIYNICISMFEFKLPKSLNLMKLEKELLDSLKLDININVVLLAKIMQLFSKKAELKKGRSIYINVEPEDIIPYEPIVGYKPYTILEKAYMCGIDDFKHLSLFKITRNKYNLQEKYWYNWEYHASFSPLWEQRIRQFGGIIDYINKKVIFKEEPDDDLMQEFYERYGLEPDEQKSQVQNKSIQTIEKIHDWKWFNNQYKKNGLFHVYEEELDEFDIDGLTY